MAAQVLIVTGTEELNVKLAKLAGKDAKAAIRKASRVALKPVAEAAKSNAPRKTGRLARSVKVKAITRSRSRVGSRVTTSGDGNAFSGETYYGGFQEYGWKAGRRTRNADLGMDPTRWARRNAAQKAEATRRNNSRRSIAGTQFMKRAADAKKEIALQIYRTELARLIVELAK